MTEPHHRSSRRTEVQFEVVVCLFVLGLILGPIVVYAPVLIQVLTWRDFAAIIGLTSGTLSLLDWWMKVRRWIKRRRREPPKRNPWPPFYLDAGAGI